MPDEIKNEENKIEEMEIIEEGRDTFEAKLKKAKEALRE